MKRLLSTFFLLLFEVYVLTEIGFASIDSTALPIHPLVHVARIFNQPRPSVTEYRLPLFPSKNESEPLVASASFTESGTADTPPALTAAPSDAEETHAKSHDHSSSAKEALLLEKEQQPLTFAEEACSMAFISTPWHVDDNAYIEDKPSIENDQLAVAQPNLFAENAPSIIESDALPLFQTCPCEQDQTLCDPLPLVIRGSKFSFLPLYFIPTLAYNTGRSVECHQGYSTLGVFGTPSLMVPLLQPFVDARFHILNDGDKACNLGIGVRVADECLDKIFGLNIYYDYLSAKKEFHQIGIGFEMLGSEFDLRVNGYIPVGNVSRTKFHKLFTYPTGYWAAHFHKYQQMGGFDSEIETSLNKLGWGCAPSEWDPYIAAGGYYFRGIKNRHFRGGRIRAGVSYIDLLSFEVRASYDNINRTLVEGVFTLSVPFNTPGTGCYCSDACTCCLWPIFTTPIQRNEIIATDRGCSWKTNFDAPCTSCSYRAD